jgi:hypothetical protein
LCFLSLSLSQKRLVTEITIETNQVLVITRRQVTRQVVNFYNQRFQIGLTPQQMQDLVNFLQTL